MTLSVAKIRSRLGKRLQGDLFTDKMHCLAYSVDASIYRIVPQAVVVPRSVEDIQVVVAFAADHGLSVVARGAGSGLAGESLGDGLVLDMTRYLKRVVRIDPLGEWVDCEPGAVLETVNQQLAAYGRQIGPDPSSGNRATIGGCVANNATGAHSLQYGHMADYVEEVDMVLADAQQVSFGNGITLCRSTNPRADAVAGQCLDILSRHQEVIQAAQPKSQRNRSGYNIAHAMQGETLHMARLLAGSEGTLGIFTRIRLRTVPIPPMRGLVQLVFSSLEAMAEAVPLVVQQGATTCELMDQRLLSMAREALPQYADIFPTQAAALLLVEQVGEDEAQVRAALKQTRNVVEHLLQAANEIYDAAAQQRLWKSRKDAVPLLYRERGRRQPVPFMEDVSVPQATLLDYVRGLEAIGRKHDATFCYFGHAGDGELHVRPYLDLHEAEDVNRMQALAEAAFSLAWSLGGSISGEHADGLVRAAFIRRQYGDDYYGILQAIKNSFDPQGLLNPGKILNDDPDVMIKNLRRAPALQTGIMDSPLCYEAQELEHEILQCNSCGLCRSENLALRMCPVFRVLGDELGTPRAKVSVLDYWASGQLARKDMDSPELRHLFQLCVHCKACQQQCPSGVDVSKLMTAARAAYTQRHPLTRGEWLLSYNRFLTWAGATFTPVSNLVLRLPMVAWLLEAFAGLDRRRRFPTFAAGTFLPAGRRYLKTADPLAHPIDRVVYLVDAYANYHDHDLGYAVLDVLRHNQIEVVLPKQRPVPLPAICYGHTRYARRDLGYLVQHLQPWIIKGYTIVCSEPSAALSLTQDLPHFISGSDARLVAAHTVEIMEYLWRLYGQEQLQPPLQSVSEAYLYHQPCHRFVVAGGHPTIQLFQKWNGIKVVDLVAGCCGLSGTFGMQKKNASLSARMAASLRHAIKEHSPACLLTECAACKMQIEHQAGCPVMHPIKVMAKAYRLV